jgi:hypothetical protein
MILDKRVYDELQRLFDQAEKMRWDKDSSLSRRNFDEGRSFAYAQALALIRGESVT